MYAPFFGLKQPPFSIAPDPRYLYLSERHREALAHLLYGIGGGGGFVVLTGEVGAGKTTVCRCFLEQVPGHCDVAYIVNPKLTVIELLQTVCEEFGIAVTPSSSSPPPTVKDCIDPLNRYLLAAHAAGRQCVLVIDEAQNLSAEVLEQLRLLTNLETDERKLLQILLIGQPELRSLLARPELEQLAQRVIARYHLGALGAAETAAYVAHRLAVAGGTQPFDRRALQRVHALARGLPRRINLLCDRALLGAYAIGQHRVDATIVERAAAELFDAVPTPAWRRPVALALFALAGVALVALGRVLLEREQRAIVAAAPAAASSAVATAASAPALVSVSVSSGAASSPAPPAPPVAGASAAAGDAAVATATMARVFDTLPRDSRRAWRELAQAWGLVAPRGAEVCDSARLKGLHCLRAGGATPALLRLLDRPVLLTLHGSDSAPRLVRLVGIGDRHAALAFGDERWTVELGDLARYWRGGYATLWRAPEGYVEAIAPGAKGKVVDALATALARASGEAAPAPGQPLGGAMAARLAEFQLAQGLQSDGIAGATTFMRLNRALGVDEPRLQALAGH